MEKIIIVGAGGLGREVQWLIDRINKKESKKWEVIGFIDDNIEPGREVNGNKVLGDINYLENMDEHINVTLAIGCASVRNKIAARLKKNEKLIFPNLFDPDVNKSDLIYWGCGNIVCAGNILTVNIQIGDFNIINWNCTIGHDSIIGNCNTLYPSVNISGNTHIYHRTEFGTGAKIIQGKSVCSDTIIGAGGIIVKDIIEKGTYIGVPVKKNEKVKETREK